ncbi:ComEC/Rec2 family competence protein [Candidatus Poriferisodalis sp.]|uniref:ComEC/Rec2 family competence protein n=1 Tax=Candidatus Poriferisodalis sp. TaxID=3101277 RepID=UPI003B026574
MQPSEAPSAAVDPRQVAAARAAPRRFGALSAVADGWLVAGACAAALGALWAPEVPRWWGTALGMCLCAMGIASRARVLIPVGLMIWAATAMGTQLVGLSAPPSGSFEGDVLLAGDPRWHHGALTVPIRATIDGVEHRWEGRARGPAAWRLEDAAMGERWRVSGTATAAEPAERPFMWPRHLAGTADIDTAQRLDGGGAPFRIANSLRSLVEASSESLSQRDAALLAGFVYGDDRGQLPEVVHDFRATSLTHLLAVSGSNVAFVLLLFAPLLTRLPPRARLVAVALLLLQFAVLTRGEPSVLRACVLATLAVGAHAVGRRASAPRLLALAVTVLVLADPLLVRSVGFQLSVAATTAIVIGAGRVSRLLRGPQWLRLALAATLCAQAGVLPVQLAVFGSLPLVSIPANVLAGPVAGPAMVWGLIGGLAGGIAGDAVASLLHVPTELMLGWVAGVARWGASLGWPQIEVPELVPAGLVLACCIGACAVAQLVAGRRVEGDHAERGRAVRSLLATTRRLAIAGAGIGVWLAASAHRQPPPSGAHLSVVQTNPTMVVVDRPDPARALDRLAAAGIEHIEVLVARSASRAGREAVRALDARVEVAYVLAPAGLGGRVPYEAVAEPVTVAGLLIEPAGERLAVAAEPASANGSRHRM